MTGTTTLASYYKGIKCPDKKQRYEIHYRYSEYQIFEDVLLNKREPNKGGLSFNFGLTQKERYKAKAERIPDYCISRGSHISGIYMPDTSLPYGWGDVQHPRTKIITNDALLFIFSPDFTVIEIFIFQGMRNNATQLYRMLCDGFLDKTIATVRDTSERLREEV